MKNKKFKFTTVLKHNGLKEPFDFEKIVNSIWMAAQNVGGTDKEKAKHIALETIHLLNSNFPNTKVISADDIGQTVEKVLIEHGHAKTAREFILYRENKKLSRQDKSTLGVVDDIGLSYNTLYILKQRYLRRNEKGETIETPKQMFERVAKHLVKVEKEKDKKKWYDKFLEVMLKFEFTPGTRTLTNAGKKKAQLSNCFVWPLEDDINYIFKILHESTLIKKNGGGCGYNFSKIRPEGDIVGGIPELAAGPVKMMEMFDLMTSLFRQEGRYESGNMAVLNANHPDIFNFISAKKTDGYLSKTNISVGITDEFMEAAIEGRNWDLVNPRTGEVTNTVKARTILELMTQMAWQSGDPGILNLSAINRGTAMANPLLKKRGPIWATNVCGEIPLYPYESCNLGYINFTKFVNDDGSFDFKRLGEVMQIGVRMLDNVIDAAWFPVKEVAESVKAHRRVGIGCVGWAETLARMDIPYDSNEALELAEKIAKTMYTSGFEASLDLGDEKGPFPLINDSIWAKSKRKPRNVALMTFPPSSGNAVINETSFAIEPYFALAYEQNVMGGVRMKHVNPLLVKKLKKEGIYSEALIQRIIDNHGSIQGIEEIPASIRRVFKVAHDIHWRDHIKMQAAFQKWTDNAITKTINMPASATPDDVYDAYVMSWKLGCKGLTIYRDSSKQDQVFQFGGNKKDDVPTTCPDCGGELIESKGCLKCKICGYSVCELH